jgi:hypothetical protein
MENQSFKYSTKFDVNQNRTTGDRDIDPGSSRVFTERVILF